MALSQGEAGFLDTVAKNVYTSTMGREQKAGTFTASPDQADWQQFYGAQDPTKWRQLQAFVIDKYANAKDKWGRTDHDAQQQYLMWYGNQVKARAREFWGGLGGGTPLTSAPESAAGVTPQEIAQAEQVDQQARTQTAGRDQPNAQEQSAQPSMPVNPEGMEAAAPSSLIRAIQTAYTQQGPGGGNWLRAMYGVSPNAAPYTRQQESNVYNYQSAPILPPSTASESKRKSLLASLLGDTPNMGGALSQSV